MLSKNPTIKELIQIRLRQLRKAHSLNQHEVARRIGIQANTYGHYESGNAYPNIEILIALKNIYGLSSVDELIFGDAPKPDTDAARYQELKRKAEKIVEMLSAC